MKIKVIYTLITGLILSYCLKDYDRFSLCMFNGEVNTLKYTNINADLSFDQFQDTINEIPQPKTDNKGLYILPNNFNNPVYNIENKLKSDNLVLEKLMPDPKIMEINHYPSFIFWGEHVNTMLNQYDARIAPGTIVQYINMYKLWLDYVLEPTKGGYIPNPFMWDADNTLVYDDHSKVRLTQLREHIEAYLQSVFNHLERNTMCNELHNIRIQERVNVISSKDPAEIITILDNKENSSVDSLTSISDDESEPETELQNKSKYGILQEPLQEKPKKTTRNQIVEEIVLDPTTEEKQLAQETKNKQERVEQLAYMKQEREKSLIKMKQHLETLNQLQRNRPDYGSSEFNLDNPNHPLRQSYNHLVNLQKENNSQINVIKDDIRILESIRTENVHADLKESERMYQQAAIKFEKLQSDILIAWEKFISNMNKTKALAIISALGAGFVLLKITGFKFSMLVKLFTKMLGTKQNAPFMNNASNVATNVIKSNIREKLTPTAAGIVIAGSVLKGVNLVRKVLKR